MAENPQDFQENDLGPDPEDGPWIPKSLDEIGAIEPHMSTRERDAWLALGIPPDDICQDPYFRRDTLKMLLGEAHMPLWQQLTQLHPSSEQSLGRELRRKRVRLLIKVAKILIRRELRIHEADAERDERTLYWNPLVEVCRYLSIARSKLSSYSQELTGLTATQLCDAVRAENVKAAMKSALRAELNGYFGPLPRPLPERGEGRTEVAYNRWAAYKFLKKRRKNPEWTHNTWAMGFGFSSYPKFYRACVAQFCKTPHQIELELIDELIRERAGEVLAPDTAAETIGELDKQLRELTPQGHFRDEVVRHKPRLE